MQRKKIRKFAALGIAASLLLCGMVGCGSDTEDTETSVENAGDDDLEDIFDGLQFDDNDDLEYGATLRENDDYGIKIEFDSRYFSDDEMEAIVSYFKAIETHDTELFNTYTLPFYVNYYIENAYGGLLNTSAYLVELAQPYEEMFEDFTFTSLSVTSCDDDEENENVTYLQEMFNDLEGDSFCDTYWEGCKMIEVRPTISDGTDTVTYEDVPMFLVKLDGDDYICA